MGEVYRARDPRLNRAVAIKVLLQQLSGRPDARARFEREAQTIAGLNHPHICVLYDVGQHEGADFLVMEFLEGETLARRLERGPLPPDLALRFATQIADALDKAHRQEIVHRDLKPGNIMLTKGGVKLLDFGLAKLRQSPAVSTLSGVATNASMTAEGTILGTLQYMSPEQLEGIEADARADIFALGTVLYEMLTGKKAFDGKSHMSLMSSILKDTPPPVSAIQPLMPPALDRLIATCLAKDADDRWQTARDLWRELQRISESVSGGAIDKPMAGLKPKPRTVPLTAAVGIFLIAVVISSLTVWRLKPPSPSGAGIARLVVALPPGEYIGDLSRTPIALSPDGKSLAYVGLKDGAQQLFVRTIESLQARPVADTQGAYVSSRTTVNGSAFSLKASFEKLRSTVALLKRCATPPPAWAPVGDRMTTSISRRQTSPASGRSQLPEARRGKSRRWIETMAR
jgi:serine/threonine protein kinase